MKTVLLIIFLSIIEICYAQSIPHKASITPSKDAVLSSETFTVTYSLTEVEGNVYIGITDGYFEIIGDDRWEGYVKMGETVNVTFTVKFKEKIKPYLYSEKVSLGIGFSYHPFGDMVRGGEFKSILISLSDFKDFKDEEKRISKDSTYQGENSIQSIELSPIPYDTQIPRLRKEIIPDTNSIKLECPKTSYYDLVVPEKNNLIEGVEIVKNSFNKPLKEVNTMLPAEIELRFYAASTSFRDLSNQQKPWQYFTVEILGLQDPNDLDPVVLAQQIIGSSTTGGFTISTTQNYPYYKCAIILEGGIYSDR